MPVNRRYPFIPICILLLAVICTGKLSYAQPFNNEWINYANSYYKFKVGRDGLYRISETLLRANGLEAVPAEHFRLYRNGVEVPLYTSIATGPLPTGAYLEFIGKANDGEPDRVLYREADDQHTTRYNLHSDTAVYFLTVESNLPNKRFSVTANEVATNSLPVEPYFMQRTGVYFREKINPGAAIYLEQYLYSSSYDRGEYWSSQDIRERTTRTINLTALKAYSGGPDAQLRWGGSGNTTKTRRVSVAVNGTTYQDTAMNFFNDLVASFSIPVSAFGSDNATVAFTNVQPPAPVGEEDPYVDRMVLSFFELDYPRQFDFGNATQYPFELPARNEGYYLEIRNFNTGGVAPVLYDTETLERYNGDVQTPGVVRFSIKGSSSMRKLVLVSQAAGTPIAVNTLDLRKFTDLRSASNQGDFLIISNPLLYQGSDGSNPVEAYRSYRSSAAGGGYSAKLYDIHELTDQFAFGIKGHPLSVKNFIRYARANFSQPVSKVFLIGKGVVYTSYRSGSSERPRLGEQNLVPTYGNPGSDNMLSSADARSPLALTDIGRLSVIHPVEVENYLEKVKEYELQQRTPSGKIEDKLWVKNVLHITGAFNSFVGQELCNFVNNYKNIVEDSLTGATVEVLCKAIDDRVEQTGAAIIRQQMETGLSLLTYFGHSSANTLQFSIEDPGDYNNQGKYPVYSVNGCYAGDFFQFSPGRFTVLETLTEKFVLTKQRGAIAFLASTHYGVVQYLDPYLNGFYQELAKRDYGTSLGGLNSKALELLVNKMPYDYLARIHAEQINLHGDPALVLNFQPKPDYVVEASLIEIDPAFISLSDQEFKVKLKYYNMGKVTNDSVRVEVKRVNPDGTTVILYDQMRPAVKYADSLVFDLPLVATQHKGQNSIVVTLDGQNIIPEVDENNNTVAKTFFVYEDELSPAYPYNYSIVSNPSQKLFASTANPFSGIKQYVMEIDTTALFNSVLKRRVEISSGGGLVEFDPQTSFLDSVVYYWRTSPVPEEGGQYIWRSFSFQFRNTTQEGFNQSHYFQHTESDLERMKLESDRKWAFGDRQNTLVLRQGMYPTSGTEDVDFAVSVNDLDYIASACVGRSLVFNVFDPKTFLPWKNVDEDGNNLYRYGSGSANCRPTRNYNFEFSYMTASSRKLMMDFLDSIPDGHYVVVRSFDYHNANSYAKTWLSDTAIYGAGNSLYHKLWNAGFSGIDAVNAPKSWGFIYQKNKRDFVPQFKVSEGIYDRLFVAANCVTPDSSGVITSPAFGPAKAWKELRWNGHVAEAGNTDKVNIQVIGIRSDNVEVPLRVISLDEKIVDVSGINANEYPKIKLSMNNADTVNFTPYQLDYWKLTYEPVPEGAIAPNLFFTTKDTVSKGELVEFGIAFKNISNIPFDSLKVKVIITDQNNVPHELPVSLLKPLPGSDTVMFRYKINTEEYPGLNTLYIDFNPDNHQPEQYHFNNFLYRNFYVSSDRTNPVMDVTFDGVHILNGDIVSAKPRIQIKLTDESTNRLLADTSLMKVQVKYPDGTLRTFHFNTDTLRFIPATSGTDNTAMIEFNPAFLETFDQETGMDYYELIVTGKDASDNPAGKLGYSIEFTVINKPMISNLLNYPNPFTTSTAFVFTITGSVVPTNFKIQILTITGKIVREITGQELGPLRIGRNITEYKWDGTDQYGQRLANGVYLYRVVSMLNGRKMDKYKAFGDNTDKFFNKGYGKMYLMR